MKSIFDRVAELESVVAKLSGLVALQAAALTAAGVSAVVPAPVDAVQVGPVVKDAPQPAVVRIASYLQRMIDICEPIAAANWISLADLRGKSRAPHFAHPRQEAMSALADAGYSRPKIARFLNRDQSTITHGIRVHRARLARQAEVAA